MDRFGPQAVIVFGGVTCALGWIVNSQTNTLGGFYFGQILAGIGAGAVYGSCIGNALKWFPNRRGLAACITAAGFGAGSALTVVPIQTMIRTQGFQDTFLYFGLGQGILICLLAFMMMAPTPQQMQKGLAGDIQARRDFSPSEVIGASRHWLFIAAIATLICTMLAATGLKFYIPLALAVSIFTVGGTTVWRSGQPIFTLMYLMYLMFVLVGAGGLVVTANLASIAQDLKVGSTIVSFAWLTLPALTMAATLDRILNGLTRPFFGWVSDKIGRENTMFVAFMLEGVGIFALQKLGHDPVWFVFLSGMVFFAWGEIYSLFPATCTDTFGAKYASTNAGLLYTAKGTAALLVPYASSIQTATGSWDAVFFLAAGANILAAVLALVVLKPWRKAVVESCTVPTKTHSKEDAPAPFAVSERQGSFPQKHIG